MVHWKRNLVFIWISQFLSIAGFAFAMPFAPFYIQDLGITDPERLKLYVALFAAAAPLSLAVSAPIWGLVADRYGRRLMLLRANFGAALFLILMGSVDTAEWLIVIRCFQGVLTGTMTAAQAMVAAHTPSKRSGFALGSLSSAVCSGATVGLFFGGVLADLYGFRTAYLLASLLLVAAGLLVLFGTSEDFQPPEKTPLLGGEWLLGSLKKLQGSLAILLILAGISFTRRFDQAWLALLVQDIHGQIEGASMRSGVMFAFAGVAGFIAGIVFGNLADRVPIFRLVAAASACAGLLVIPHAWVNSLVVLTALRFGVAFCLGGLEPVFHAALARQTADADRGLVFGWSSTARSIGWVSAPLISGGVAAAFGLRATFITAGILLFLSIPLMRVLLVKRGE